MMMEKWKKLAYIYLILYFIIAIIISPKKIIFLTLIFTFVAVFFVILYVLIKDEILFYIYLFISIIVVIPPFSVLHTLNAIYLAGLYAIMSLLMLHIVEMQFGKYGTIERNTYFIYLLSLPLSFFVVYMVVYMHPLMDIYDIIGMVAVIIVIYLIITYPDTKA